MIEVKTEEYCNDCPYFKPQGLKKRSYTGTWDTSIYCKHGNKCKRVADYIRKLEGNGSNE